MRLFAAQNEVQQVVVLSACLLILRNQRVACGLRMDDDTVKTAVSEVERLISEPAAGLVTLTDGLT